MAKRKDSKKSPRQRVFLAYMAGGNRFSDNGVALTDRSTARSSFRQGGG